MRWPWSRPDIRQRADVTQAKVDLELTRAQRHRVEATARKIREATQRNNFAANTFKLDPGRKR